jgi:hypothetical protein
MRDLSEDYASLVAIVNRGVRRFMRRDAYALIGEGGEYFGPERLEGCVAEGGLPVSPVFAGMIAGIYLDPNERG